MVETKETRDEIIQNNMGLVHACANKFRGRGIEYDDLFQAGCIGLIKATDGFDPSRGFAFSTYAVPVILGEIKRLFRDGGTLKVGRSLKERSRKALAKRDEMMTKTGKDPTISELAAELGVEVSEAAELLNASQPPLSLTYEEDGSQIDVKVPPPEEELSDQLALHEVIDRLEERDQKLIRLRYMQGYTQSKTAVELGVSQVQISRREKIILKRLRQDLTG